MTFNRLSALNPVSQYRKAPLPKKKWVVATFGAVGTVAGATLLAAAIATLFFAAPHLIAGIGGPLLFLAPGALGVGATAFFIFSVVMRKKGVSPPISLAALHADLGARIRSLPKFVEGADYDAEFVSLCTHAHQVLPNVYLGDYRAYLSVDPKFIEQHKMVDSPKDIFGNSPTAKQQAMVANLDAVGCLNKGIKTIISVTQFAPGDAVPADDWSRFTPQLEGRGVTRIQLEVDDVEGAWQEIKPHLDTIFEKMDDAILNNHPLLIHCVKGASRSASIIYAYLINRTGVSVDQAYNYIKSIRHQVELKPCMRKGLEAYAASLQRELS